jgi:AraC family transcriptional regulator of adaptative response / DNA-3-methyladenine glycosylase II
VSSSLEDDPLIGPLVAKNPGWRVPGTVDGAELVTRAILGQQVSVAGARRLAARIAEAYGRPLAEPAGELSHAFPTAEALAGADLPLPASRARALRAVAGEISVGRICVDPGADRDDTEKQLLDLPGIGPWTASYVRMRALGDPDVFLGSDLGIKKALGPNRPDPEAWRPWRSYAGMHLWASLGADPAPHLARPEIATSEERS